MSLLQETAMEQGSAKMAWFGPQGAGKTASASQVAIGLSINHHEGAPIAFFDTEKGSDFAKALFDAEGVKLLRVKSRSFADLLQVVKEAESQGCCALIVDSMSHVWTEIMDAFCRKKKISRIEFQHWRELKEMWRRWTDTMLNSPVHMLICGRAGKEYEYQNNESGKKELITTGTKFKAEGEFGYEPDVLVEMWLEREDGTKRGSHLTHKGIVLKDRTWAINGRTFDWKDRAGYKKGDFALVYKCFEPYFNYLNIGGVHHAIDSSRSSDALFDGNGNSEFVLARQRKEILLEKIENTLVMLYPGQDQKSKKTKLLIIEGVFKTRSWEEVKQQPPHRLEEGLEVLVDLEKRLTQDVPEHEEGLANLLELSLAKAKEERAEQAAQPF